MQTVNGCPIAFFDLGIQVNFGCLALSNRLLHAPMFAHAFIDARWPHTRPTWIIVIERMLVDVVKLMKSCFAEIVREVFLSRSRRKDESSTRTLIEICRDCLSLGLVFYIFEYA